MPDQFDKQDYPCQDLTEQIIGCALAVHREFGPGLLESIYEEALTIEMASAGLPFVRQVELFLSYKGQPLASRYKVDMVVDDKVVLELKTVEAILPVHAAQLLSYMKLGGWRIGLLLNFKSALMRDGVRRMVV
ncbi:MAG TPA: GxxExxY protein [Rectinemataceae bacterium]|nr:GxxExxY protein [Rectinemataceae bacterium]